VDDHDNNATKKTLHTIMATPRLAPQVEAINTIRVRKIATRHSDWPCAPRTEVGTRRIARGESPASS